MLPLSESCANKELSDEEKELEQQIRELQANGRLGLWGSDDPMGLV